MKVASGPGRETQDQRRSAPVVVVTGAGRGIGRATAEVFAARGYVVVIAEILPGLGRRTAQALLKRSRKAVFIRTDVAESIFVGRMVRDVVRQFGRIDCLVNNAGILRVGQFIDLAIRDLDRMLAVNLLGPLLVTRAALPAMLRQPSGAIINVASQLGKYGIPEYVTYCASKFGVVGFTKALATELAGTGVRVWAVCPGRVDTPMARQAGVSPRERPGLIKPERVARTILDLATGRRRAPSGSTIDVV